MTRRRLFRTTLAVIAIYTGALAVGIILRVFDRGPHWALYGTYKDMLPLIIAIPAAYLAYSFQRRGSYVQALRAFWSQLVKAVYGARAYTYLPLPTRSEYAKTLADLSVVIEDARAIFENIPAPGSPNGWYPFEPIKQIHDDVRDAGYGDGLDDNARSALRTRIDIRWKAVRKELLREYDRDVPTYHHAWYMNLQQSEKRVVDAQRPLAMDRDGRRAEH